MHVDAHQHHHHAPQGVLVAAAPHTQILHAHSFRAFRLGKCNSIQLRLEIARANARRS